MEVLAGDLRSLSDGGQKAKRVILNEFCANPDYNRKHAIRLLNGPRPEKHPSERRRRRGVSYSRETLAALTAVWEAAGYPWSVRLKALLPQCMHTDGCRVAGSWPVT